MHMPRWASQRLRLWSILALLLCGNNALTTPTVVDDDGAVHLPALTIPYSSLSSDAAQKNFQDLAHLSLIPKSEAPRPDINTLRKRLDDQVMRPGVEKLRRVFMVRIKPETIGGIQTDVIEPAAGVARKNRQRVLINLHGGGFMLAAGLGGQMESIPIASIGAIRVISIDYRQGPEYKFPAASEDVATVYRELLKRRYPAKNIGIYGCSAGGMLAAQATAWFQSHGLPKPGAIGMFGAGALVPMKGDSNFIGSVLHGQPVPTEDAKQLLPYFDLPDLDVKGPLVSPAYSPSTLARFPPSLVISGTRDIGLSPAVYTHARLIQNGIDAHLHVWEGVGHCSFAQPIADPEVPETREAWSVIVNFFDKYLGR